jgi:hypothetical protein
MEVVDSFGKHIFLNYSLQITDALTISKLSINILFSKYIKSNEKNLPLIKNVNIFSFIKDSYSGGITEVYMPYGENLNYYDINSMYPFVAKNVMPGNKVTYIELQESEIKEGKSLDLNELFGFFYCKIKTREQYLGLLPIHSNNSLILPNGEFYGTWFTEELKLAKENGYEIQIIKGYNFNKVTNVFNEFVDELFEIRRTNKGHIKSITKLILNSSFGRFGMSINKPITEIMNGTKLNLLFLTHNVLDTKKLYENKYLVNYEPKTSNEELENIGLDVAKVYNELDKELEENNNYGFVSISTAAAITAYARVYINTIKL